ncbi:hypothetical protein IFM89_002517 [Coptis chinensis]|uniref:NAC-A/B domain-containing protein n=1 Tax=Coptis chinensis TaxID=261450 RepID=A0A835HIF4_9MAGN|nr:hypothetical protein IFM89_002517 [Coptis chinensis]
MSGHSEEELLARSARTAEDRCNKSPPKLNIDLININRLIITFPDIAPMSTSLKMTAAMTRMMMRVKARHGDGNGRSKQSRSEKKSCKAMLKLGMKAILGVSHVTVKKSKNVGHMHLA